MRCCIDASRPDAVSATVVGHAALIFCADGHRCIGEFVEGCALRLGRLDRLRDQVDREPGDFAAVLAAQQRQPVRPGAGEPRGGR